MKTFEELVAAGDPIDPDLVSLLAAEGVDDPTAAHSLGEAHWIAYFAERAGFNRDFDELLENLGLTWETASSAERLQCSPDELEVGVATVMVVEKLGAQTFAEVFIRSRDEVQRAMAKRDGLFDELVDALGRSHLAW